METEPLLNGVPSQGNSGVQKRFIPYVLTRKVTVAAGSSTRSSITLSRNAESYLMAAGATKRGYSTYEVRSKAYNSGQLKDLGCPQNPVNLALGDYARGIPIEETLDIIISNSGGVSQDYEVRFIVISTEPIPSNTNTALDVFDPTFTSPIPPGAGEYTEIVDVSVAATGDTDEIALTKGTYRAIRDIYIYTTTSDLELTLHRTDGAASASTAIGEMAYQAASYFLLDRLSFGSEALKAVSTYTGGGAATFKAVVRYYYY